MVALCSRVVLLATMFAVTGFTQALNEPASTSVQSPDGLGPILTPIEHAIADLRKERRQYDYGYDSSFVPAPTSTYVSSRYSSQQYFPTATADHTKSPNKQNTESQDNPSIPVIPIAAGAGSGVAILAIICLVFICIRRKKKKERKAGRGFEPIAMKEGPDGGAGIGLHPSMEHQPMLSPSRSPRVQSPSRYEQTRTSYISASSSRRGSAPYSPPRSPSPDIKPHVPYSDYRPVVGTGVSTAYTPVAPHSPRQHPDSLGYKQPVSPLHRASAPLSSNIYHVPPRSPSPDPALPLPYGAYNDYRPLTSSSPNSKSPPAPGSPHAKPGTAPNHQRPTSLGSPPLLVSGATSTADTLIARATSKVLVAGARASTSPSLKPYPAHRNSNPLPSPVPRAASPQLGNGAGVFKMRERGHYNSNGAKERMVSGATSGGGEGKWQLGRREVNGVGISELA